MPFLLIDIVIITTILLIVALVLMVIGQLWTRVPWVPTPKRVIEEMVRSADLEGGGIVYDLGAGDARILIAAKRACPSVTAIGYEMSPLVWLIGRFRIWCSKQDVQLIFGNSLRADVSDADCIFLYLFPNMMPKLERKFDKELRKGARVFSLTFRFPEKEPIREVIVAKRKRLLVYEW